MEAGIKISGIMQPPGEQQRTIEFYSLGDYSFADGECRISYRETELTGLAGTVTDISVTRERVIVRRSGMLNSTMEFRVGEKSSFLLDTPYGSATMGIETRAINASFGDDGGELTVKYVMNIEHAVCSMNRLVIIVKLGS